MQERCIRVKINDNISALRVLQQLNKNDMRLANSLERLSSGLQINKASDNAVGLAITHKMNAQIRGLDLANRNAMDGISLIQTAEGALSEVHNMLQRMKELSVQAASGTYNDEDRANIQEEVDQLLQEINRVSEDIEFNEKKLLNGNMSRQNYAYTSDNASLKVGNFTDGVEAGVYVLDITQQYVPMTHDVQVVLGANFPAGATVTCVADTVTIKDVNGFEMVLEDVVGPVASNYKVMVLDVGSIHLHIGANKDQNMEISIPDMSPKSLGIENISLLEAEDAEKAISIVADALSTVSAVRSRLGAYQNRLEHTVKNLEAASQNLTASYSRIMDTDMAEEMANYTQSNILTQASTSMLAQANQRPQTILQLLQR